MKRIILLLMAAFSAGCGIVELEKFSPDILSGENRPDSGNDKPEEEKSWVTYVTTVEYPEDYDWSRDYEKGSVKCSLVLYSDGKKIMKLAVGDSCEISSDPDMHRVINGNLYTDYSNNSETVIKKNGRELFRYQGREMITDMLVVDGDVYTLGHSRSGVGFAYRKNGESVFESNVGSSYGRLFFRDDVISFAYMETTPERKLRYYIFEDSKLTELLPERKISKMWDIVPLRDEVVYIAENEDNHLPFIMCSGQFLPVDLSGNSRIMDCGFVEDDGNLMIEGMCSKGAVVSGAVWNAEGKMLRNESNMTVSSVCMSGDDLCCHFTDFYSTAGKIYIGSRAYDLPASYIIIGGNSFAVIEGVLYAGLSSPAGSPPLLWKDGQTTPLGKNGFISSISANWE